MTELTIISDELLQKFDAQIKSIRFPDDLIEWGLTISTMTITCQLDTEFNITNIGKYLEMSSKDIISVKYGDETEGTRALVFKKINKPKKKKKKHKSFYNQATVKINSSRKEKPTNIKLFKNGSLQMTGCNSVESAIECLNKLCIELTRNKAIIDVKNLSFISKPFVTNPTQVGADKINDFKIGMINSNFKIGFRIDRDKLYEILIQSNVECTFEPCVHACVSIKYNYNDERNISVFVFESGAVIITGARNKDQIVDAFRFITCILCENYNNIVVENIDGILQREEIRDLLTLTN